LESSVEDLEIDNQLKIKGVKLNDSSIISCKNVVITTGTFLRGVCHIGK
jgi:tRNA uridine 5-carboxymethylaminomethyl modification enzyme